MYTIKFSHEVVDYTTARKFEMFAEAMLVECEEQGIRGQVRQHCEERVELAKALRRLFWQA